MEKPEIQIDISRLSIIDKENTHPDKIIKKDGQYFLNILQAEIERFTALCERAEKDIAENSLSEEASGKIRAAIGKSQLLLTKKFKQFEKLCNENIENSPGKKRPMSTDLEGFWDMVSIQVEDVNRMFDNLEELRNNNWKESIEPKDSPDGKLSPTPRRKSPRSRKTSKNNNYVDEDKARKDARQRLNDHLKQVKLQRNADNGGPSEVDIRSSKSASQM
ncbi:disks large-associated protein 1-like [Rhopilema esculentum]|uniref:disks large-associated protein 1-like n=1 Tax=Rhopilema esculentum TaxID=499914 RepID=UPI0031D51C0C|eukprot:gene14001-4969_t